MKQMFDSYYQEFNCYDRGSEKEIQSQNCCNKPADSGMKQEITEETFYGLCNNCVMEKIGLAQAYVPFQRFSTLYSQEEALAAGTAFPELNMPYQKRRCI